MTMVECDRSCRSSLLIYGIKLIPFTPAAFFVQKKTFSSVFFLIIFEASDVTFAAAWKR